MEILHICTLVHSKYCPERYKVACSRLIVYDCKDLVVFSTKYSGHLLPAFPICALHYNVFELNRGHQAEVQLKPRRRVVVVVAICDFSSLPDIEPEFRVISATACARFLGAYQNTLTSTCVPSDHRGTIYPFTVCVWRTGNRAVCPDICAECRRGGATGYCQAAGHKEHLRLVRKQLRRQRHGALRLR